MTAFVIMAALINRLAKMSIGLVLSCFDHRNNRNTVHPFVILATAGIYFSKQESSCSFALKSFKITQADRWIAAVAAMTKRKNNEFGGSSLTVKWLTWGLVFLSLLTFTSTTRAELVLNPLTAGKIKSHLYGQTISGEYSDGQRWAERFNSDGTSRYSQMGQVSSGTMTLNGNIWCFTYHGSSSGGCFEVWKHGPNCFSFYSSNSLATLDQRQSGKGWDARGWYVGQQPTCAGDQIS